MTSQALDRSFERVENIPYINKKFQACVKKADEEGITLFGIDDKKCWTSDTEQSYFKFGTSFKCNQNGKDTGLTKYLTAFVYRKDNQGGMFYVIFNQLER